MVWRSLLLVAVASAAVVVARPDATDSAEAFVKLCATNICKCTTEEIVCKCTKNEKLEVKKEDIADKTAVTNFEIEDCNLLILAENAFTNAHKLKSLKVSNVNKVDVKVQKDAFQDLQSLWIGKVPKLNLSKEVFAGAKNLDSIAIQDCTIQELHEGTLHSKVKYLELNNLTVHKIDKNAIKIEGVNENSTVHILKSKIGNIENQGMEIVKFANFALENCDLSAAENNSIILKDIVSFEVKGNTFRSNVDTECMQVSCKNITFLKNTLLNIDTSKEIKSKANGNETLHSLQNMIMNRDGNTVNCNCGTGLEITGKFGNNMCVNGKCNNATVEKFTQNCKTSAGKKVEEVLNALCPPIQRDMAHVVSNPTQNPVKTPKETTTQKQTAEHDVVSEAKTPSNGNKIAQQFLPLFVVYVCSLIL